MKIVHLARDPRWWIATCLVAATALLYAPVAGHEFLNFDDLSHVVRNPNLATPATPLALLSHFSEPNHGNWLPIYWISLHLDHALYGDRAAPFLLTNVAIHILASLLLFAAFERMTRDVWPSAFVAFVFALHPLHVESVAWISERKDVLAGFFFMAGLYAYARYAEAPSSRVRQTLLLLCFALGLMSKASLVTFPFVLLLLDVWPLRRLPGALRPVLFEKLPLVALAAAASLVTYATQEADGQTRVGEGLAFTERLLNALESYAYYFADTFWPSGLAPLYPHPYTHVAPSVMEFVRAGCIAVVLAVATVASGIGWRTRPALAVGWLWYLGTLVPMLGLVQVGLQARADRYMYLPQTGLAIALAWGVADFVRGSPSRQRTAVAAGAIALAALALGARAQLACWSDTITLYERVVAVTERNGYAHEMLGYEYAAIDRNEDAALHFAEAARVNPGRVQSLFGLAVTRARLGQRDAAISAYQSGLHLQPTKTRAHGELGVLLVEAGRHADAIPHLTEALRALPDETAFRQALERARAAVRAPGE